MELKSSISSKWTTSTIPNELKPGSVKAFLLFGPDQGGVFEYSRLISRAHGETVIIDAANADFTDISAKLSSGSLFDNSVSVRLDNAGDKQFNLISKLIDLPFCAGSSLIICGGDLKPTSKLRKLFSSNPNLISAPLYLMQKRDIAQFAKTYFQSQDLLIEQSLLQQASNKLSGDRASASRSCEMVVLHTRARKSNLIEQVDISAVLDDIDERAITIPLDLAIKSDTVQASIAVTHRLLGGENFVKLLRSFSARLFKLQSILELGLPADQAINAAKPPIFWAEKQEIKQLISILSLSKIDKMLKTGRWR